MIVWGSVEVCGLKLERPHLKYKLSCTGLTGWVFLFPNSLTISGSGSSSITTTKTAVITVVEEVVDGGTVVSSSSTSLVK